MLCRNSRPYLSTEAAGQEPIIGRSTAYNNVLLVTTTGSIVIVAATSDSALPACSRSNAVISQSLRFFFRFLPKRIAVS